MSFYTEEIIIPIFITLLVIGFLVAFVFDEFYNLTYFVKERIKTNEREKSSYAKFNKPSLDEFSDFLWHSAGSSTANYRYTGQYIHRDG